MEHKTKNDKRFMQIVCILEEISGYIALDE